MKSKTAQRKPKVSPETAAARLLNRARWKNTTPEERSQFASHVASQPRSKDRCDCGVMTRKRAEARGRTWEHKAGCTFHPETTVSVSADTKRTNGDQTVAETRQGMPKIWREKPR